MEVFFPVSFHWHLLQFINGLLLTEVSVRPVLVNLVFNEFFVLQRLHHSNLLNQLENLILVWSEHVVPFLFHLFQIDHTQKY